jgi:aspartate aminotransferase
MNISHRVDSMQASPIRKFLPYSDAAKARGIKVYHLNIGQPDIETPKEMMDVYHNFSDKILSYGPSQGLSSYRKALVNYYGKNDVDVTEDDIIVTTAGSEAIIFAMLATCNPGDEILVPEPFYTNYNGFASIAGVKLKAITTYAETGFALPERAEIEKLITPNTKAFMICNPGNPTGKVYSRETVQMVADIAKDNGLYVISDEVYREFVYDGLKATSIMEIEGMEESAILVDSISKRYSACGARIGCIISRNKDLMKAVLKLAQARLCPPTIDQKAAEACVNLDESYINAIKAEYCKRRDIVFDALQTIDGVVCIKPEGAFYIVANLPIEDAEDFTKWMLEEYSVDNETVMFAPATGFYATPNMGLNEVRFAYILNENDLKRGMSIFKSGLEAYKKLAK